MNKAFDQSASECTLYAVANQLERQLGIVLSELDIVKFFAEHKLKRTGGQDILKILHMVRAFGIKGHHVKDFHKEYSESAGVSNKELLMKKLRRFANESNKGLIFCLFHREKPKKGTYYPLDKNNVLKPLKTPVKSGGHALSVDSYDFDTKMFKLENSYGEKFGERGFFYLTERDFWTECYKTYSVEFSARLLVLGYLKITPQGK